MLYCLQIFSFYILKTFTERFLLTISLFLLYHNVTAQLYDNFDDNDLSTHPVWTGNTQEFAVAGGIVKLHAPETAAQAYLVTSAGDTRIATWECWLKLDFNPSANNFARIYLTSDNTDLTSDVNGYFVMIGNSSDEVSLYRQSGATKTKIIDGADSRVNLAQVNLKIKVTRDKSGHWQLFTDVGTTGRYTSEGSANDIIHSGGTYFGIFCNYTATRSQAFYFDDVSIITTTVADTDPPILHTAYPTSATTLDLTFSENIDASSVQINYFDVTPDVGAPRTASLQSDQKTIRLTFAQNFPAGKECVVTASNIRDSTGNVMTTSQKAFLFYQPVSAALKDIIITEILADPAPTIELPEAEFLEIFNRSKNVYNLEGWTLQDGASEATLLNLTLSPGQYLILTTTAAAAQFSTYGKAMGVPRFPTLNNAGETLVLKDSAGTVIDAVTYHNTWYNNTDKEDGGWSLEIIDPDNLCSEYANWTASGDTRGGTPGKQNSVFAEKPDLTGPKLIDAIPITSDTLRLRFDEKLDSNIPPLESFTISPLITIAKAIFSNTGLTQIDLVLAQEMKKNMLYSIALQNVRDCSGNLIQHEFHSAAFALPDKADSLDVVINEILFNPRAGGVDFIEVVNTSAKFINLKNWSVANVEDGVTKNSEPLTASDYLLKPGEYLVLTENLNILKGEYLQTLDEKVWETKLPSFNDDEGSVALISEEGKRLDYLRYTKSMHSPFIKNDEGVSLERITTGAPTQDMANWKSTSTTAGFATPGYLNSNALMDGPIPDESIIVDPEVFAPLSGQPDFTQIRYKLDRGGFIANIKIYNAQGQVVKQLASNQLLGTEGFFRWDGDHDDGNKARIGNYMVWIELFENTGIVKTIRKRVAIAAKF